MSVTAKECKITGCSGKGYFNPQRGKVYFVNGYCMIHYRRARAGSKFLDDPEPLHATKGSGFNRRLYSIWVDMKKRCSNQKKASYSNYGARGIRVCERWSGVHGYQNFVKDMGERPSKDYSLDRIDNDGNYEPSNCRWADRSIQQFNKRLSEKNKSGYAGVYFNNSKGLWIALIGNKQLCSSRDKSIAIATRLAAEKELGLKNYSTY